jgi:hypothetical protein
VGSYSDGMACAMPDGMKHIMSFVACTVSFVAPVNNGHPCLLTPGVPCQYNPAWGKGALHGVVGAGVREGSDTLVVGPA